MVGKNSRDVFPHPAGILLFNRPHYAEQTLASLKAQELPLDPKRLVIVRDGYVGSRDERYGEADLTGEVDALVERFFPDATFVKFENNRGIALAYEELATRGFSDGAQWATFFEEDFVVDPDYTQVLVRFIDAADDADRIGCLSATGDVSVKRNRGQETLYPDRHLWAYAMRRSVWEESRDVIDAYLSFLAQRPYWERDADAIISAMADLGIVMPGSSQDYAKLGFMRANGYLALNTAQAHGYYIGQVGQNSTKEHFAASGYELPRERRDATPVIPEITTELLDELELLSRSLWARENFGYRQTFGERAAQLHRKAADLRSQLRVTQEALAEQTREVARLRNSVNEPEIPLADRRGGWTWFGGSSSLSIGDVHLLGLVRRHGLSLKGESCVAVLGQDGEVIRIIPVLRQLDLDDHNVPTIVALDSKRFLVAVTGHNSTTSVIVARGVVHDGNVKIGKRTPIEFSEQTSYAHIVLDGLDSFLLMTRCGRKNFVARRVNTATLEAVSEPMRVFPWEVDQDDPYYSRRDGNRPYLITRESGSDVLFALTNDHPRAYRNGIVAGRFRGADIFDLDDNLVHSLAPDAPDWDPFSQLTPILNPGGAEIPWVHDIASRSEAGQEIGVDVAYSLAHVSEYSFRREPSRRHPDLRYAVSRRLRGRSPEIVFAAEAGPSLYGAERHYAGGIALNPRNTDHVIYSVGRVENESSLGKNANPAWSLMSREVTHGISQTRRISEGKRSDSYFRPVFSRRASGAASHALFVMRGRYSTYSDFATRFESTIFRADESCVDVGEEHLDLMYPVIPEGAMPHRETAYLARRLRRSQSFIEFGAGGSTLLALSASVKKVLSVESDVRLAGFLKSRAATSTTDFTIVTPALHEMGAWGYPISTGDLSEIGRAYSHAADGAGPFDTVLVDGRFRVACALTIAGRVTRRTMIMVDDYSGREEYHTVEEFLGRPRMRGRLATFVVSKPVTVPAGVLEAAFRDPR